MTTAVVGPLVAHASNPSRVTEWNIPTSSSGPLGITASAVGGDGSLWFVEDLKDKVGKITANGVITDYALAGGSQPYAITWGPDGNAWYVDAGTNKVGKVTPAGTITEYATSANAVPAAITVGPDNNLWFAEYSANKIGKITTSGTITEYAIGSTTNPVGITPGSDGNLWFAQETGGNIGSITTSGTVTQHAEPSSHTSYAITAGPDGNLWYTDPDYDKIGKMTTGGSATEYAVPTGSADPNSIAVGPDGNLWFTEGYFTNLGKATTAGTLTEISPGLSAPSGGIGVGKDNNLWFTEYSGNKVGRYALPPAGGALTAAQSPTGKPFCLSCFLNGLRQHQATSSPINTATGNFYHSFSDISIPGRSYPLEVVRTYNSQNASVNGPFGYGWNFNYQMNLSCSSTTATITQEDGSQATFTTSGSCSSGTWAPSAPRFIATLSYASSTWTFKRQGRDTYTFNSSGQLTSETDANGYTTSLTYSGGNLTTITDPAGRTLTLGWTGSHITSLTDANVSPSRSVGYTYSGDQLTDVTDVAGGDTSFGYDGSHRVTTMKDPVCQALGGGCPGVQNHYDGNARVDWQKDQLNRETTFAYSGDPLTESGGTTTVTDPQSNVVVETYEYGLRVEETRGSGTADASSTQFFYDPNTLAPTEIIDGNGNATAFAYDASGNPLTSIDALGNVTTTTYNAFNEPLTVTDGNGKTTTMTYDGNGNLAATSRPVTGTSCTCQVITYNHANGTYPGDVTTMVDGDGKTWSYHFDSNGYQDQVKDPLGNVTGTQYNAIGWTTNNWTPKAGCTWNSSTPTGCSSTYKTVYTRNSFGDVLTVTDPLSHVATLGYDANRNKTSVQDGNSNTTTTTFDVANEPTTVTRPDSTTQVTDYFDDGTVQDQKDGAGHAIQTYAYNHREQVISTTDALSNVTTLTRDLNGNVLTKQDPGGNCGTPTNCTKSTYNADNELATVTYSDGVTPNITSITRDSIGQVTGMSDGTGSPTWAFDNLHRLTSYTSGNGDTASYVYNLRNEPTSITYPNSVGTVTRAYDDAGQFTSTTDWNSKTTTFTPDADGNETGQTSPSTTNVTDTFGFNAADQMTSVSDSNGTTLFSATYTRDSNGQLASDSSVAATVGSYKYTSLNQLCYGGSASTAACSSPPVGSNAYAFDNADNLTTNKGSAQQFNNADELCWSVTGTSANNCATTPTGATTYGYSNKGERTSTVPAVGSATCDGYDQVNRLTSVKTGTGSSCTSPTTLGTYAYDGSGLRQSKTVSGTTTHFNWDESGRLPMLLQEKGSSTTSYIYGPNGLPVEQIVGSTTTYLHHDQLGSTRLITDSAGSTLTATTITFDPYGNAATTIGTLTSNLMFSGEYKDSETGLYFNRARSYDPATAQFLTLDPAVGATRSPYGYVAGNPLNATDPTGQCWDWIWSSGCKFDPGALLPWNTGQELNNLTDGQNPITQHKTPILAGIAAVGALFAASHGDWANASNDAAADTPLCEEIVSDVYAKGATGGDYGLGTATQGEADAAGDLWVGSGWRMSSDGVAKISADGLRQYRGAALKKGSGAFQANFQERAGSSGAWTSNGHLDVTP